MLMQTLNSRGAWLAWPFSWEQVISWNDPQDLISPLIAQDRLISDIVALGLTLPPSLSAEGGGFSSEP